MKLPKTEIKGPNNGEVLVVFGKDFPVKLVSGKNFDVIVADKILEKDALAQKSRFVDFDSLIVPSNIYEGSALAEELSYLKLPDGSRLAKSFMYKGYELWWMYCNSLFLFFCLPFTQYKKLLEYLKDFKTVYFYKPAYKSLFDCYLEAHGSKTVIVEKFGIQSLKFMPFGIFIQIIATLISLPVLMIKRRPVSIFIGDKFEKNQDYDFRMKLIYQELRQKKLPFVEFIRSHESWKAVWRNIFVRRRPVVYSEAVAFVGRFLSVISGGRRLAHQRFGVAAFALENHKENNPEARFKLLVATHFLRGVYGDIWSIRIMKLILRLIGVKASFIAAALDRNFHTVFGCKLNSIPTVGILHGVASKNYNMYDFLPSFDGEKGISVDAYGLWSSWWKEYYLKNGKVYRPEQLFVSGPMRPLEISKDSIVAASSTTGPTRVLFMAEQTAVPSEVMPYLNQLIQKLSKKEIELTIKFRPYRDGFEDWLMQNEPSILKRPDLKIMKGGMQEAIKNVDVVVGCHSTGVLEGLLQSKVPIFLRSKKWGDYYSMTESEDGRHFFAENPEELMVKISESRNLPPELIADLCERYFGDPRKNGSKWVVDRLEDLVYDGKSHE